MEKYLMSYKKRVANAKESGDVDESDADPIPFSLYNYLCKWSIEEDNVFLGPGLWRSAIAVQLQCKAYEHRAFEIEQSYAL